MNDQQQAVRLADLIDTARPENEGVWVQYQNTPFWLRVTYYGKQQMQKMFEAAKTTKLNMRTLREEEEMDKLKFRKLYARKVIQEYMFLRLVAVEFKTEDSETCRVQSTPNHFKCRELLGDK